MRNKHVCPDCLSAYKASRGGKAARKAGAAWGRDRWPDSVYHNQDTKKCQRHHSQGMADSAARRAGLEKATPKWVDRNAIKRIYEQAAQMNASGPERFEVDHIVPLKGDRVSGLHVPWNLRIIRDIDNRLKSNKFVVQ